ncbi:DUF1758 domain-containing protein [Trichonephila clavipes]|nr:DUF1758 domain-containing protein [Trichonephila clavipes]
MQYLVASVELQTESGKTHSEFSGYCSELPEGSGPIERAIWKRRSTCPNLCSDLLTMVMKNAVSSTAKRTFQDSMTSWRDAENPGEPRTNAEKFEISSPLVKSCLPEEVLITWERNRNHHELSDNTAEKNIRSLENLMTVLHQEVQGEEMVVLSRTGFASNQVTRKKEYVCTPLNEIRGEPATAAALISLKSIDNKVACIFCDKPHPNYKCFSAKKMSLDEKLKILFKKGACYSCLTKSNLISRQCDLKSKLKCNFCSLSHNIMCSKKLDKHLSVKNSPSTITLSNQCSRDRTVYLQTLCNCARSRSRKGA